MKIMVPVRRVPNPDVKVRLKKDGTGIETEGVNFLVSPFDEYAVEESGRITEKGGGEVFLVSIGTAANEFVTRFEREFAASVGRRHCIACGNGTGSCCVRKLPKPWRVQPKSRMKSAGCSPPWDER